MDIDGEVEPRRILEGTGTLRIDSRQVATIHYRISGATRDHLQGSAILVAGSLPFYHQRLMLELEDGTSLMIQIVVALRRLIRFTILGA